MKRIFIVLVLFVYSWAANAQQAIPKPNPPRLVVDNAHVLSPEEQNILESKLDALNDTTSNQIVVLTVPSLNDQPLEDVAVATFRSWGIGDKKNNNGVLLLVSINDRKVKIEVGYGLEGAIPDVTAKDIIENFIVPNFKQGNYFKGIDEATDNLSKAAVGEYKIQKQHDDSNHGGGSGTSVFVFMIVIVFIILAIGRRGGGGSGGGGGGLWLAAPLIFGASGFGSDDRDSGSFGGGDSSGGDSGGGFGGFDGGSSGGGGASGDW